MNKVLADFFPEKRGRVKVRRFILLAIATAAVLALPVSGTQTKQPRQASGKQTPTGNVQNGRHLFIKDGCYECHGTMAQGGVGPRLAPHPLALSAFVAFVRKPLGRGMPPFSSKVLSDSQLADIHAYLETIPEPPPVKDIPLLNQ